jgi:hypothetical protein
MAKRATTRALFSHAINNLANNETTATSNALQIVSVFFQSIFSRGFVSTDIIDILAGLRGIDSCFVKFVDAVEQIIFKCPIASTRVVAIRTLAVVAGGLYQTSLSSYFFQRNLFTPIIKVSSCFEANGT